MDNLPDWVDQIELSTMFHRFGKIIAARIFEPHMLSGNRAGFILYQTPKQAALAVRFMHRTTLSSLYSELPLNRTHPRGGKNSQASR